uniref:Uncharacterized protein n=1 Tax=Oryza barthii TaxID=65489 RepID=A0A0D3FTA5_9ORYZ
MVDVTNLTAAKDRRKRDREVCCTPSTIVTGRVPIRDITNYAGFGATQAYSGTVILKGLLWVLEVLIHCFDQ